MTWDLGNIDRGSTCSFRDARLREPGNSASRSHPWMPSTPCKCTRDTMTAKEQTKQQIHTDLRASIHATPDSCDARDNWCIRSIFEILCHIPWTDALIRMDMSIQLIDVYIGVCHLTAPSGQISDKPQTDSRVRTFCGGQPPSPGPSQPVSFTQDLLADQSRYRFRSLYST